MLSNGLSFLFDSSSDEGKLIQQIFHKADPRGHK